MGRQPIQAYSFPSDRKHPYHHTWEQQPYIFDPERFKTVRLALPAGDYSLVGSETRVAVERKSMPDFVSTVIRARKQFHAELQKLANVCLTR